ncbi:L,D-transpeptidase [Acetobacter estunensis]|uniref:L,D-transpeptidase n=1 Tax=Acetobacter estunensis TaxID=104097 RepID=UPI0020C489AB|nr:L,D-transpeptidase [Acetobacter estunensis]
MRALGAAALAVTVAAWSSPALCETAGETTVPTAGSLSAMGETPPTAPTDPASSVVPPESVPAPPPVIVPPLPSLDDDAARAEAMKLSVAMRREVVGVQKLTADQKAKWVKLAQNQIALSDFRITRAQVIAVVDRNPKVQRLALILALPDTTDWMVIGSVKVSTGTAGRKYYYITPTGVFPNTTDRLGYRAEGTKNENGIRGIGAKGMRVWDFGWHNAVKGWLTKGETGDIRLEMHATDPQFLEWRLGHPASEGCVRIPATFNVFMDHHGLLDVEYEQAASYDPRFKALLPKDREPSPIAGEALVVVDSGEVPSDRALLEARKA